MVFIWIGKVRNRTSLAVVRNHRVLILFWLCHRNQNSLFTCNVPLCSQCRFKDVLRREHITPRKSSYLWNCCANTSPFLNWFLLFERRRYEKVLSSVQWVVSFWKEKYLALRENLFYFFFIRFVLCFTLSMILPYLLFFYHLLLHFSSSNVNFAFALTFLIFVGIRKYGF